jgi:hypothetical protein
VKQDEGLRIGSKGERGRGILMSGETNGQFLLVEVEVEPGYGPPRMSTLVKTKSS